MQDSLNERDDGSNDHLPPTNEQIMEEDSAEEEFNNRDDDQTQTLPKVILPIDNGQTDTHLSLGNQMANTQSFKKTEPL